MNIFKKITIILAVIMGMTAITQAQNISYKLLRSNQSEAVVQVTFGTYHTETVSVDGVEMQKLLMADAYPILEAGSPELLQTAFSLITPEGSNPETEILDAQYTVVEHFALAPSKGKLYRNQDPAQIPYTKGSAYQENRYLAGNATAIGNVYQLRDYQGVSIKVYPFDYNPAAQTLKVYSSVTVKVTFNSRKSVAVAKKNNRTFDALYANHFLNYGTLRGTPIVEEGSILIIAPEEFMAAMQPYVDWKIRNGYPTEMVSVMAAGNNANAIKSYILDYYNEHNLAFVIIVGDNAQFPTPTIGGNKVDNYFTQLVGNDSYPDIILGKISAENVNQVSTQVQRFLEYEQNPQETEHFPVFMGVASNQGPGDNNEYDYQHIRNIDNKLLNYTYTSGYELFEGSQGGLDASGNPSASMVTTAVNNGIGIACYCGHGAEQQWVTTDFNNNNVNALTNVGKLPFILSVACVNGAYHYGTCFAEAWLRATHDGEPTGAVGFLGSTINQPWNSPMCTQDAMIEILTGTHTIEQKSTFGGMFFNGEIHMLDVYNDVEVFRTWILFGDPTLLMRTAVPQPLEVNYAPALPIGIPSVTFSSPVENAKITITKNGEIVGSGKIQGGELTLLLNEVFLPTDSVKVLATATNYLPFEGLLQFIPNDGPYVIIGDLTLADEHLQYVNNRANDLPEFGKVMKVTPQIINIGNETASNVKIHIFTEDEYVSLIDSEGFTNDVILSVSSIDGNDTLSNAPFFFFKVNDLAPANHNSAIKMEIIFNDDTLQLSKSVKLYAPNLAIKSMVIDDTEAGNGNRRMDYEETANCLFTISNTGNMPIVGGDLYLRNPGNELILDTLPIAFPAIEANSSVTVSVPVTASSVLQEPTTSYISANIWVNYYNTSAQFPVKVGSVLEDWETGDFTNLEWQNSSMPWTIVTQTPHSGTYCAKSGAIQKNNYTRLSITVISDQPDTISFFYKVSSEENHDKLTFRVDGQKKDEWSGNTGWTRAAYLVEAGTHTYSWTYSKDSYGTSGKDCAWIDDIFFPCNRVNYPMGIEENSFSAELQIWPNPTTDAVHVQINDEMDSQDYTYQLFSLTGKLLQGGRLSDNHAEIDLRNYATGTYLVKIENRQHQSQTVKIIKK